MTKNKVLIIGAGPAGLACANELVKNKTSCSIVVVDKNERVGGLSRTHEYNDLLFDVGPHRFFTKNDEVLSFWKNALGKDFLDVSRLTRIIYKNKLFLYPIQIGDVLKKMGIKESIESLVGYAQARIFLKNEQTKTFEQWITKNFGKKLFRTFFKTYTEKVWGIPCNQIGAEWASQRIKNLSVYEVVKTALLGDKSRNAKSLVSRFNYPKYGAGHIYEKIAEEISDRVKYNLCSEVTKIKHKNGKIVAVEYNTSGKTINIEADYFFSSMPLTHFIDRLDPKPHSKIIEANKKLYYRDHITVNLIVKRNIFPDNWIYVHSPELKMARATSYYNFSKKMSRRGLYGVGIEYFVFKGDEIWSMDDQELVKFGKKELVKAGLMDEKDYVEGFVMRETEAYPTYYLGYKKYFGKVKDYLNSFSNLQPIGRGGLYKYNNMDHSIYSGMLAARNFLKGANYDIWEINEDAEYHEEK